MLTTATKIQLLSEIIKDQIKDMHECTSQGRSAEADELEFEIHNEQEILLDLIMMEDYEQ